MKARFIPPISRPDPGALNRAFITDQNHAPRLALIILPRPAAAGRNVTQFPNSYTFRGLQIFGQVALLIGG